MNTAVLQAKHLWVELLSSTDRDIHVCCEYREHKLKELGIWLFWFLPLTH